MDVYRDYGTIGGRAAPNNHFNITPHNLVWLATHSAGGTRLPARYRSFISFSFGGKNIEDFDLIACCDGDTMSRRGYADFEDLVTSYDIMDGQYYHGTHFKPNTLSLKLVSDDIDLQMLDNFLHWFKGGITRELILAEHPNRAIMARVASAPELDVLPFEKKVNVTIGDRTYETSTTVYRGFIDLELTADTPFWYAKLNFLTEDVNHNVIFQNGNMYANEDVLKEALKVMYEDTVPVADIVENTMHFGIGSYALIGGDLAYTVIAGYINEDSPSLKPANWDSSLSSKPGYFILNGKYYKGARIESSAANSAVMGRITGPAIADEGTELTGEITPGSTDYQFFYGGTAPSPATLSFTINITANSGEYIGCIANSYKPDSNNNEYSTITIESVTKKEFDFTTPNVMTSWNKAYKMFNAIITQEDVNNNLATEGTNWSDFADNLRDYIRHPAVRTFAIQIINYYLSRNTKSNNYPYFDKDSGIFKTNAFKQDCILLLRKFFLSYDLTNSNWNSDWSDAEFEFNSETGTAQGKFKYWQAADSTKNIISIIQGTLTLKIINANFKTHTENVGDMLRSNWLIIEDHNSFTSDGHVREWKSNAKTNAHKVYHNLPANIKDLKIGYKFMYL